MNTETRVPLKAVLQVLIASGQLSLSFEYLDALILQGGSEGRAAELLAKLVAKWEHVDE